MKEITVEEHLVKRVRELGGEIRKVKWIGRRNAPDRLVMLPTRFKPMKRLAAGEAVFDECIAAATIWVEVKNPDTILTFPANAHERAQAREHKRMRDMGQRVEVIGPIEQVDSLLS